VAPVGEAVASESSSRHIGMAFLMPRNDDGGVVMVS